MAHDRLASNLARLNARPVSGYVVLGSPLSKGEILAMAGPALTGRYAGQLITRELGGVGDRR